MATSSSDSSEWIAMFRLLKDVPLHHLQRKENRHLYNWLQQQVKACNPSVVDTNNEEGCELNVPPLSEERLELLKLLGLDLANPQFDLDKVISQPQSQGRQFQGRHSRSRKSIGSPGTIMIASEVDEGGMRIVKKRNPLQLWIYQQQKLKREGRLPRHRIALLEQIGFEWNDNSEDGSHPIQQSVQKVDEELSMYGSTTPETPRKEPKAKAEPAWQLRYNQLLEFKKQYGHMSVPSFITIDVTNEEEVSMGVIDQGQDFEQRFQELEKLKQVNQVPLPLEQLNEIEERSPETTITTQEDLKRKRIVLTPNSNIKRRNQ
jgi:hypothetical protein